MPLSVIKFLFFTVWNLKTGKCVRTFKHKFPVTAVALGAEMCVSGCEGGKVKVWDMTNGQLIKVR
jgi:F-box/WD-40 domain protein 10